MTTTATTPTTTTSTGLAINTNPSSLSLQPLSVFSLFLSWESCLIPTLSLPLYLLFSLSFFCSFFFVSLIAKSFFSFSILCLPSSSPRASSSFSPLYSPSYFLFVDLCLPFLSYSLRVSLSFFSSHSVSLPIRSPTTSLFRCPYHRMFHTHTSLLHNMYLK